jgi:hypothetical protein
MSFSSIGKFLDRFSKTKIVANASAALALEAGTAFLVRHNGALASRTKLVSVKGGVAHAMTVSAPARAELLGLKERLIQAMKSAAPIEINDLRVEVRGTLVAEPWF